MAANENVLILSGAYRKGTEGGMSENAAVKMSHFLSCRKWLTTLSVYNNGKEISIAV